ncbi:helix-turn-helix transcriptional regulator [Aestuariibacter sp. AA17]|uniref:Helix-turn-helix transcriptional regulator n=1 Tax=Fluctibacter corallii TaxID=2984329 RepID=A0ABT3A4V6_9ALTE|nr:helix-turn-helix domain-containing protein [Aestuariibacter sp. AA17]MCV2883411.1 helix-turn-helix transcriptional regulator [Aestuariibacter sp. AA17]
MRKLVMAEKDSLQLVTHHNHCGIAEALQFFGDRWSLLIIRNVLMGIDRFDALQEDLQISRNILTKRLNALESDGFLLKTPVKEGSKRHRYAPTEKSLALAPVLIAMIEWSQHWGDTSKSWSSVVDAKTGQAVKTKIVNQDGEEVTTSQMKINL